MTNRKIISVIIPTYNEERDIQDCLQSLLVQDYPNFEIIVVDDGSTDATIEKIKKYDVKLFQQHHAGAGIARNLGASKAKGQILVFVDADMTFASDFITKLTLPIRNNLTIGTTSSSEFLANSSNALARCWNLNKHLPKNRMTLSNSKQFSQVFRAITKSDFDRVAGFDPIGYDDDHTLVAKLKVFPTDCPDAVFYHRNPDTLFEAWSQAKWAARRRYKSNLLGKLFSILRSSVPVSLIVGLLGGFYYREPYFLPYKLFFDLATGYSLVISLFDNFNYK